MSSRDVASGLGRKEQWGNLENGQEKKQKTCEYKNAPLHAWNVSPKVASPVSRAHLYSIDQDWVALNKQRQHSIKIKSYPTPKKFFHFTLNSGRSSYLQEPANVRLVVGIHEDYILKEPEERTVLSFFWLQHGQYAVELKEESSGSLCRINREKQVERVRALQHGSHVVESGRSCVPNNPFRSGFTIDRSLHGLPPIRRSKGPQSASCNTQLRFSSQCRGF